MAHDPQATDETRALRRKLQKALKEAESLREELEQVRHGAGRALYEIDHVHAALEEDEGRRVMEARRVLMEALGRDETDTRPIKGLVAFSNGESHVTDAEMNPVCSSADATMRQWRHAKVHDPYDPDHDNEEAIEMLTCAECKELMSRGDKT